MGQYEPAKAAVFVTCFVQVSYNKTAVQNLRPWQKKWQLLRDGAASQELFSSRFAFLALLPSLLVYRPDQIQNVSGQIRLCFFAILTPDILDEIQHGGR